MEYVIDKLTEGLTVLEYIKKNVCISRAHLKHIKFIHNGITVNGEHVTVRYRLQGGDKLSLLLEDIDNITEKITPVELPLNISFEDDDCVVPSKPGDMPTHPSFGHYDDTVANALVWRYETLGVPFVFRPINRLDRNTSGLLLIAKNRVAAGRLSLAMQEGRIKKMYLAILDGELNSPDGEIQTYMRRTQESIIVRENCNEGEGGDFARTLYHVLSVNNGYTLVAAMPVTGRTHQLRVHFASLGAPILGDELYGTPSDKIPRHALHSCALEFPLPLGEEVKRIYSQMPDDMQMIADEHFEVSYEEIFRVFDDLIERMNG